MRHSWLASMAIVDFCANLLAFFSQIVLKRLAEIKEAIRRGDAGALGRVAHTLKGSVGNFAAQKAFAASQRLENMGREGELGSAGEACVTLESELKILSDELRRLTRNSSTRKKQMHKTDEKGRLV
jgi:two-component system sensor histidine kinase/response regulator